ncbi:MAG: hypothetical protein MRZ79_13925 [Bacteroidia bacterium]|nr:hypothetical protein [Bacteroidia bacterium]
MGNLIVQNLSGTSVTLLQMMVNSEIIYTYTNPNVNSLPISDGSSISKEYNSSECSDFRSFSMEIKVDDQVEIIDLDKDDWFQGSELGDHIYPGEQSDVRFIISGQQNGEQVLALQYCQEGAPEYYFATDTKSFQNL